jgi:F-type H+-transporting ATPase subunit b
LELAMATEPKPTITSIEHIPKTEHGKGFPPFDATTFASQLVWLVLAFAVLYLLMARVALPRIGSILEARRTAIADDLAAADRLKGDSDAALAAYEKSLAEARARAQSIADETRAKEAAAAEENRKELEDELNAKLGAAEQTIAATKASAMGNVRGIATEAAAAIVERLMGTAPAAEDVNRAVADVLKR